MRMNPIQKKKRKKKKRVKVNRMRSLKMLEHNVGLVIQCLQISLLLKLMKIVMMN